MWSNRPHIEPPPAGLVFTKTISEIASKTDARYGEPDRPDCFACSYTASVWPLDKGRIAYLFDRVAPANNNQGRLLRWLPSFS